jgi:hypothetical protein
MEKTLFFVVDVVDFQAFLGATSQSQNDTPLLNQA